MNSRLRTDKILGVNITVNSEDKTLEFITKSLEKTSEKLFIVTPNPEILMFAHHHAYFKHILNSAQVAVPDGNGVVWAAKLLGKGITRHITGVDLMEKLCERLSTPIESGSKRTGTVGFLGGKTGVAEKAAVCLQKKYPGLKVVFVGEEWPEKFDDRRLSIEDRTLKIEAGRLKKEKEIYHLSSTIKNLPSTINHPPSIDVLFVAFGFPKQEEWIYKNLPNIPIKAAMGVGGAFDYISGEVTRAPKFIRDLGFEWLYRLVRQPWRWKRQLALIEFVFLTLKEWSRKQIRLKKNN